MRYIEPTSAYPNGVVYFASDRTRRGRRSREPLDLPGPGYDLDDCLAAVAPGNTTVFATADHDSDGNIYVAYGENVRFHTYLVTLTANRSVCHGPSPAHDGPTEREPRLLGARAGRP